MMIFDDEKMPNWFEVNNVDLEGLPPLSPVVTNMQGRVGGKFHQQEVGSRSIIVRYTITGTDYADAMVKYRSLMKKLYAYEEKVLEFTTEKELYYNAILSGDNRIRVYRNVIQGELDFLIPDGVAHSKILKSSSFGEVMINEGVFNTPPRVVIEVDNPSPSLTVIANEKVFSLGNSDLGSGGGDIPNSFNPRPIVYQEKLSSITGWANGSGYEGTMQGSVKSDGYYMMVDDLGERGEKKGWHGPVKVKSFRPVQDFQMRARVKNKKVKLKELGRIQIYLQDENGVNISMIELRNADPNMIKPMLRARIGESRTLEETYGHHKGIWGKWEDGEIWIARVGQKISFFGGLRRADGTLYARWNHVFNDVKNEYQRKVARIQVSLMGIMDNPLTEMGVRELTVMEYAKEPTPAPGEGPVIVNEFQPGDVVVIDSDTGEVSLNNEPAYHLLDPSSEFPEIKKGYNQYLLTEGNARGSVWYSERY